MTHGLGIDLKALTREELEIRLRQTLSDLLLTKEESEESSAKYVEMLEELEQRNAELEKFKSGLEEMLKAKNAELLLAKGSASQPAPLSMKAVLEGLLPELAQLAAERKACFEIDIDSCLEIQMPACKAKQLRELLGFFSRLLLSCCGSGGALNARACIKEAGCPACELSVSGEGVDEDAVKGFLCNPGTVRLLALASSLSGYGISFDPTRNLLSISSGKTLPPAN